MYLIGVCVSESLFAQFPKVQRFAFAVKAPHKINAMAQAELCSLQPSFVEPSGEAGTSAITGHRSSACLASPSLETNITSPRYDQTAAQFSRYSEGVLGGGVQRLETNLSHFDDSEFEGFEED